MKDHPTSSPIVLLGGNTATRAAWAIAWAQAWADGAAPAVALRDVQAEPPTAAEPAPTLCLLLAGDGRGQSDATDATEAVARQALLRAGWTYGVLRGALAQQLDTARRAWQAAQHERSPVPTRWRHVCGRCGDGDCERTLFDRRHGAVGDPG